MGLSLTRVTVLFIIRVISGHSNMYNFAGLSSKDSYPLSLFSLGFLPEKNDRTLAAHRAPIEDS